MRIIYSEEELESSFSKAKTESLKFFGSDDIYIEKLIEKPRHIEVQILGDSFGNILHYGERDCTVQRRHQKLIEESPSISLTDELRESICEAAVKGAKAVNYLGAGTIEFLLDKNNNFYFMEMNTRIQVEHPVTEFITNVDMVREQINIANGGKISKKKVRFIGHSIECRINAEDPSNKFQSSPGTITAFHSPGGFGVRVDTHCYAGYKIPSNYDSLIAKLIVHANSRQEAIERMKRALGEFIIEGIKTTIPFQLEIFNNKDFISNNYDTKFIDNMDK